MRRFFNEEKVEKMEREQFTYEPDLCAYPANAVLSLTNQCNFRCTYCFVDFNEKVMSLETARKAINMIVENGKRKNENPSITFFGGEPLLQYDSLIVPLINEYRGRVRWGITTNGLLLTEDMVDFFVENNVGVLFSMDGCKESHDMHRKDKDGNGTFSRLYKNMCYLLLKQEDTILRATFTKATIPYIYENYLFAKRMGFKEMFIAPNEYEEYDEDDYLALREQLDAIGLEITKYILEPKMSPPPPILHNLVRFAQRVSDTAPFEFMYYVMKCGFGTTSVGISPEGDIIACQERNSKDDIFNIGHVDTGIDQAKHEEFLEEYFRRVDDMKCPRRGGCPAFIRRECFLGQCVSRLFDLSKDKKFAPSSGKCIFSRAGMEVGAHLSRLFKRGLNPKIELYFRGSV